MREVVSPRGGYVSVINARDIGLASNLIGAGRDRKEDAVDPAVGVILEVKVGEKVEAGSVLCRLYYTKEDRVEEAAGMVEDAFRISAQRPDDRELILEVVRADVALWGGRPRLRRVSRPACAPSIHSRTGPRKFFRGFNQPSLHRIVDNISFDTPGLFVISHQMIVTFILPKRLPSASQQFGWPAERYTLSDCKCSASPGCWGSPRFWP
jgi:hypothetical protein